jgi:hypothetical protein
VADWKGPASGSHRTSRAMGPPPKPGSMESSWRHNSSLSLFWPRFADMKTLLDIWQLLPFKRKLNAPSPAPSFFHDRRSHSVHNPRAFRRGLSFSLLVQHARQPDDLLVSRPLITHAVFRSIWVSVINRALLPNRPLVVDYWGVTAVLF